jgi:hypothetical protein
MPDLSPAAASIVQAFDDRYELLGGFDDNWQELCIAAALRATATRLRCDHNQSHQVGGITASQLQLLAIAAELEG